MKREFKLREETPARKQAVQFLADLNARQAPQQRPALTDEQIDSLADDHENARFEERGEEAFGMSDDELTGRD